MAMNENRLDVAERLLKPHLREDPFDVAAIRMLAELAARIGRWRDAENLLRRAVELAARFPFPIRMWRVQNAYWRELHGGLFARRRDDVRARDSEAETWLEEFRALGELLAVRLS